MVDFATLKDDYQENRFRSFWDQCSTGYFGVPGRENEHRSTKVHIVYMFQGKRVPICGTRLSDEHEFQWCANGVFSSYIECNRCKHYYWEDRPNG